MKFYICVTASKMNPQFLQQQQPPICGPPPSNTAYGELNANLPPKELQNLQPFSQQKISQSPSTSDNSFASSQYYINDIRRQTVDTRHGSPVLQTNQNILEDKMSTMALSNAQRPPSSQDYQTRSEKNVSGVLLPPNINGVNNHNHYTGMSNLFLFLYCSTGILN